MNPRAPRLSLLPRPRPALLAGLVAGLALPAAAGIAQESRPAGAPPTQSPVQAGGERTTGAHPKKLKTQADLSKLRLETRRSAGPVGPSPADPAYGPPAGGAPPAPEVSTGPVGELVIPEDLALIDFGSLVQGESRTRELEFSNTGVGPLKVSAARPSCGCTTSKFQRVSADGQRSDYVFDSELSPGDKLLIEVGVNTEGKQGAWEGNVTLFTNDTSRTDVIKLKASIQPFFVLQPSPYLNFDKLLVNDTATRRLTITSPVADQFALALSPTSTLPEYLKVTLEPKDPIDGRAGSWDLVATLGPGAPEMPSNNWPILLESDEPMEGSLPLADGTRRKHQVTVYTLANVVGLVNADPNYLSFGIVPPGAERVKVAAIKIQDPNFVLGEVPVRVRGQTDAMTEVLLAHARTAWSRNDAGEPVIQLTISDLPESFAGPFGGFLDIDVGHPSKAQISLPFTGVCRETVVRPATPPAATPSVPAPPAGAGAAPSGAGTQSAGG